MSRIAYLTPDLEKLASANIGRCFFIPWELSMYFDGAVQELCMVDRWEAYGTATPEQMSEYFTELLSRNEVCMPIGTIIAIATTDNPDGFLMCDGSNYLASDYPELYTVLPSNMHRTIQPGNQPGFATPDMTERFLMGSDDPADTGNVGGEMMVTLGINQIPQHSHTYTPPVANVDLEAPGAPDILAAGVGLTADTGTAGGGEAHNNMPPYFQVTYWIKCR